MDDKNMNLENECQEMKFFMNENESDLTFIVENKRIPANKWFLRMKSDVFEAMLSDNKFKESTDGVIEVVDIRYQVFKSMLLFLYTNRLVLNDDNDYCLAIDVFKCGDYYHIKPLMSCIEERLTKMVTVDNLEVMYEFARAYHLEKLCSALNVFIKDNIEHYMSKGLDELKRISTLSDSHLMELIVNEKDTEIQRLEKILSDLARNCVQCKNRITFSGI